MLENKNEKNTVEGEDQKDLIFGGIDQEKLKKQIAIEHKEAFTFISPKWETWKERIPLYSNTRRKKTSIGDTMLFTVFQTVLAQLYSDQLNATFEGRGIGDGEKAELLTKMAEFDYDEMERGETDYDWIWDSMFYGNGLLLMMEFDSESVTPIQEVIDPLTFLRDPRATSAQGSGKKNKGAMRFGGWHVKLDKFEIENSSLFKNTDKLFDDNGKAINDATSADKTIDENRKLKSESQGSGDPITGDKNYLGSNASVNGVNWFTRFDGKLVYVTLTSDFKTILRYTELPKTFKTFPIIDRKLFPTSHNWDGVSVPDLVEDQHRASAKLKNIAMRSAENNLYSNVFYDETKVTNKKDLNREMSKNVGVKGDPNRMFAQVPRNPIGQEVFSILGILSSAAQAPTATPNMEQGMQPNQNRTATENLLVDKKVDERRSLTAKVFGWSEKNFWKQWYLLYSEYLDSKINKKIVRIKGSFGNKWEEISLEDIKTEKSPDIQIESVEISDAKRANKLNAFSSFIQMMATDPNANMRYAVKKFGMLQGTSKSELDILLPPTIDELEAEEENKLLNDDEHVPVEAGEDHKLHLAAHNLAKDTNAKYEHIQAHQKALLIRRDMPELFPQVEGTTEGSQMNAVKDQGGMADVQQQSIISPAIKRN